MGTHAKHSAVLTPKHARQAVPNQPRAKQPLEPGNNVSNTSELKNRALPGPAVMGAAASAERRAAPATDLAIQSSASVSAHSSTGEEGADESAEYGTPTTRSACEVAKAQSMAAGECKDKEPTPPMPPAKFEKAFAHARICSSPQLSFLKLPQELSDIIFDMAYPAEDTTRYICKDNWDKREMENLRQSPTAYLRKPFPSPKVNEFLVSKKFYECASKAWVGNQHFVETHMMVHHAFRTLQYRFFERGLHKSIIVEFCTKMSMKLYMVYGSFHTLPNLKDLSIVVDFLIFKSLEPRFPWKCALDREELETIMLTFHLDKLSGLVRFSMTAGACSYAKTDEQEKQLAKNVQSLEDMVKPLAMGPRKIPTESTQKVQTQASRLFSKPSQSSAASSPGHSLFSARSLTPQQSRPVRSVQETKRTASLSTPILPAQPLPLFGKPLPLPPASPSRSTLDTVFPTAQLKTEPGLNSPKEETPLASTIVFPRRSKNSIMKSASRKQKDQQESTAETQTRPDLVLDDRGNEETNIYSSRQTAKVSFQPMFAFGSKTYQKSSDFTFESPQLQSKAELRGSPLVSPSLITTRSHALKNHMPTTTPDRTKIKPNAITEKDELSVQSPMSFGVKQASPKLADPLSVLENGLKKYIKDYSEHLTDKLLHLPDFPEVRKSLDEDFRIFSSLVWDVRGSLAAVAANQRSPGATDNTDSGAPSSHGGRL